ncbi:MAG: ABC transporter permease [Leptospiraceae bacterium]|nr:ABC transporter permease [Leptospiraceae bacterium]
MPATLNCELNEGAARITLQGRMDVYAMGAIWKRADDILKHNPPRSITIDLAAVAYCDGAGIAFIKNLERLAEEKWHAPFEILHASEPIQKLIQMYGEAEFDTLEQNDSLFSNLPDTVGRLSYGLVDKIQILILFLGEFLYNSLQIVLRPRLLRMSDTIHVAEKVGADGLPIIGLIGFLLGLIMAFQSAVPMRQFGVEIFVANLVALSLFRELGPLITAVILAGRSGSAFAAELGTMKVNEELSALNTMGLEPMRFLVIPRIIAATTMIPFLTIFFNFLGLIGGSVVLLSMGYPMVTYVNQVLSAVNIIDMSTGLFKAIVFGALVAGVGCFQGMKTGTGASAVGDSTTKAVVNGIILIAVTDGLFAVLFYMLEI